MNPTLQTLLEHRSIRRFKAADVPSQILDQVLEAATMASTSGNMQAYSIIVTKDSEMKKRLYEPHFKQSMILEAPIFLTFCADFHRMRRWLKISEAPDNFDNPISFMIASIDAILASQNAAIAAESLGLGICYLGTTLASCRKIGEILNCPSSVVPVVGFALGYPDETPTPRRRLPITTMIHHERYKIDTDEDIKTIYASKEDEGMKRYSTLPKLRELIKDYKAKNLAQIYTKVKYTRGSHIDYSRDLISYLKEQDFDKLI